MAGGVLKTVGGLLLTLGVLFLLGGGAAAVYGYMEGQEGGEGIGGSGLVPDSERQETGQQLMILGAGAAGAGVLALVLGGIFLSWGGGRAQRALLRSLSPPPATVPPTSAAPAPPAFSPVPPARLTRPAAMVGVAIGVGVLVLLALIATGMLFVPDAGPEGRLQSFVGGSGDSRDGASLSQFRFYPVFHSDVEGEGRYVLDRLPDDVSMETRSTDGNVGNNWALVAPPTQPLRVGVGETVRYHWAFSFEVAATVSFTAAVVLDGGNLVSQPETRTVAPGQQYVFEGVLSVGPDVRDSNRFVFTPTLEVEVGAPVFLVVTEVEESYLDVSLQV